MDLANPENLFKAIYRAVLRHNHLSMARWMAAYEATRSEEGWRFFKTNAFEKPVTEEEAGVAFDRWGRCARLLMEKMREFERRLLANDWNSLDYRACIASIQALRRWMGLSADGFRYERSPERGIPPRQEELD